MAIRARTMPYECPNGLVNTSSGIPALCDCCFELQSLHEDELDDNGKRLYLTRGKLRTKLTGPTMYRWEARAKRNQLRRQLEKATKALEDFDTEEMTRWLTEDNTPLTHTCGR